MDFINLIQDVKGYDDILNLDITLELCQTTMIFCANR